MPDTFVDGAAILGTIEALSRRNPHRASAWALRSAVEVTTVLLLIPDTALSPIPEMHNAPIGPYGAVLTELAGVVKQVRADQPARAAALRATKRWSNTHTADLATLLWQLRNDPSYESWMEWLAHTQSFIENWINWI